MSILCHLADHLYEKNVFKLRIVRNVQWNDPDLAQNRRAKQSAQRLIAKLFGHGALFTK